jgi:hypothetical protein
MSIHNPYETLIPLGVMGIIIALRARKVGKDQPFSLARNWIMPGIVVLAVIGLLVSHPPTLIGWGVWAVAGAMGAPLGWHRGKLTHLSLDPETGALLMRPSAAALVLMVVVIGVRQIAKYEMPSHGANLWLFSDGMIGFALGMILAFRTELWLRGRRLLAGA